MELGTVTLLEIHQLQQGKRIAYCLPTGEFIFVTTESAADFAARSAAELYGKNLCYFLDVNDVEKLQDYLKRHLHRNGQYENNSNQMPMMMRIATSEVAVWIRLTTIPLTLRLLRCIDAIQEINPVHLFADASSFVVSEDDLTLVFATASSAAGTATAMSPCSVGAGIYADERLLIDDDDVLAAMLPLELKGSSSTSSHSRADASSPQCLEDSSLANYAFEADWVDEATMANTPQSHLFYALTSGSNNSVLSDSNSVAVTKAAASVCP